MRLKDLISMHESMASLKSKKMPVRLAFKLGRNMRKLNEINNDYEQSRMQLIRKYAEKDDKGELAMFDNGSIRINRENLNDFSNELRGLLDTDLSIDFDMVTDAELEMCDDPRYDPLSPSEFEALEYMIREEDKECSL